MYALFALFTVHRVFLVYVVPDAGVSLPFEIDIVRKGLPVLFGWFVMKSRD